MENSKLIRQGKVYKVVARIRGKLYSAFVGREEDTKKGKFRIAREYAIDQTTRPIRGTKLFAFTDEQEARSYFDFCSLGVWYKYELYEADATSICKNGWYSTYQNVDLLKELPKTLKIKSEPTTAYPSCVVCSSITLRKRIG